MQYFINATETFLSSEDFLRFLLFLEKIFTLKSFNLIISSVLEPQALSSSLQLNLNLSVT